MMKSKWIRGVILFFLLITLAACHFFRESDRFRADFDIEGIRSDYAELTVFGDPDSVVFDQLEGNHRLPLGKGKFTLSGTVKTPVIVRLTFLGYESFKKYVGNKVLHTGCSCLWFVAMPGERIRVKGNLKGKQFVDLYPGEDDENRRLAALNRAIMPLLNARAAVTAEESIRLTTNTRLQQQGEELDQAVIKTKMNFIRKYPSSLVALWVMEDMLIHGEIEAAALEPILPQVNPRYREHDFYLAVKARIEGNRNFTIGTACPAITGTDQQGKPFSLEQLRGKYVIVDFWGTWCGACLQGIPRMKAFYDKHRDKVEILGIAQERNPAAWAKMITQLRLEGIHILNGKREHDYVARLNITGFPTKIVLDPQGIIISRSTGETDDFYEELEALLTNRHAEGFS